jgi:hypothetical protein
VSVTMTTDYWESVINDERVDLCPSWHSVDDAITRLNETVYTLVVLDDHQGSSLFIGGGLAGIVVAWSKGDQHLIARRGDQSEKVSIVVGGQAGEYKRRNAISLDEAKSIARAYFNGSDVRDLGEWDHRS